MINKIRLAIRWLVNKILLEVLWRALRRDSRKERERAAADRLRRL